MNEQQEKFLALYKPIHDRFERFCRARVYGNMEYQDLMNDTLLVAFKKFDYLKDEKTFLSFLIGISIRILANNHKKRTEDSIVESNCSHHIDENAHTERDAEIYFLYKALAMLPDEQRECLVLFEITGFSIKEIMDIQNSSESAVKQRLKRGRAKLLELLTFESKHQVKEDNHG
ncbi:MAG: RNA polymerase sigma factor [Flavobacteriales bacterium]